MSHAPDTPDTPTSGTHCDEEYSLPCAEALLAGTLALMTGYVQACCDSHRDAMGRKIAANLYRGIRGEHDWGKRFDPEPADDVLDLLATLAPREMRRALVTAFGNARLADRFSVEAGDLPKVGSGKTRIGFLQ